MPDNVVNVTVKLDKEPTKLDVRSYALARLDRITNPFRVNAKVIIIT